MDDMLNDNHSIRVSKLLSQQKYLLKDKVSNRTTSVSHFDEFWVENKSLVEKSHPNPKPIAPVKHYLSHPCSYRQISL